MPNYEGVFILDAELTADATKAAVTQLQDLVTKNQGHIESLQEWGKKRLAYKIRKKAEGYYAVLNFQVESAGVKKIEQSLRLNDNVIRYLIVNKGAL
ncbi:MAG: 30S ribosomal protein S6 [Candidatus Omnitrophota bacterium]